EAPQGPPQRRQEEQEVVGRHYHASAEVARLESRSAALGSRSWADTGPLFCLGTFLSRYNPEDERWANRARLGRAGGRDGGRRAEHAAIDGARPGCAAPC